MMPVACAFGPQSIILEAWPNAYTPFSSAIVIAAVESVCWNKTSAPWAIRAFAASASLPGSYQVYTQTIFIVTSGLTDLAAKYAELIPLITSGIGKEAM